ncbi:TIGR04211 family SH3 domain-containing protein [Rheinheimera texasensis]|uniref:TIGR04211 family SH3 domain-containing protein n=1 Tax=Rheinheimera texasensis TaxID=306205 RepID=UPI0032B1B3E0
MSTLKSAIAATLLASFVVSAQQAAVEQSTTAATTAASTPAAAQPVADTTTKPAVAEKPAFIIDSLSTPLRSGPGAEYRTISTVRAGESVTFIGDNPANGFVKVRDNTGAEGWLSGDYVTYNASPKANLEALKQQLSQQEMIAAQFEQERQTLQAEVSKAQSERDEAVKAAELAKQTAAQLTTRLAEENPELLQNKMVIGGGILLGGILFGLILPLITPKRRRNDRWM